MIHTQTAAEKAAAEDRLEAERKAKRQADELAAQSPFSGLRDLFDFFSKLLSAIFGAFSDTDSEYSEIDRAQAAPSTATATARQRAETLIQSVGNEKLRALSAQYHGRVPENISPFEVTAKITSHLGHRDAPTAGASTDHQGIDMVPTAAAAGKTLIHNTMPGVVVRSETQYDKNGKVAGFGNWVEVACIDGTRRRYAHLAEKGVAVGSVLHQGDVIGVMGNTGVGTGAHLHYEWRDASGKVLEPEINDRVYARNDRSYRGSTVAAASGSSFAGLVNPSNHPTLPSASATAVPSPVVVGSKTSTLVGRAG